MSYAFLLKYISTSKYAPLNLFHPLYHKCTFLQYLHPVLCVFLQNLYSKPCAFLQNILSCRFIFSYLINCTINQKFKKSYTYRSCRTLLNHFFQNYHPTGCAHDSSVQMLSKHFTFLISDTHMKMCRIFSIESFDVYSQAKLSLIARVTA